MGKTWWLERTKGGLAAKDGGTCLLFRILALSRCSKVFSENPATPETGDAEDVSDLMVPALPDGPPCCPVQSFLEIVDPSSGPVSSSHSMTIPLQFVDEKLLETVVVGPEGAVHYTLTTPRVPRPQIHHHRGCERHFRTRELAGEDHDWNWGPRPFKLKHHDSRKELLTTPLVGDPGDMLHFTTYYRHLLHENERANIYFRHQMRDESERMFLLMAILQTEIHRLDIISIFTNAFEFLGQDFLFVWRNALRKFTKTI
ncbi:hypothetical protein K438DRAFT_1789316 [Mycena galopus ATCC 62051]|nr:hypothetical protein K438DRAFT_1789316 [Mycena galopus ATCC 62051]